MNSTVETALAEMIAELEVTSSVPTAPYGYGSDISCSTDVAPRWTEITDSALIIAEHCVRRIDTPNGLPDVDGWGISITEYCNRPTTRKELYELEGRIVSELIDDDRIDQIKVSIESNTDYTELNVYVRIVPYDALTDDFTLLLSVTDTGVIIEEITR